MTWSKFLIIALMFSFTANVQANENCPTPDLERLALIELFTNTDGPNWTNSWDIKKSTCDWYGVSVDPNSGVIISLDLYNNNLVGELPKDLCNLTSLTEINLHQNSLKGSIPDCLNNLTQLTTLNLSNNNLTDSIPASLGDIENLLLLYLNNNNISGAIPANLGALSKLILLDLNTNQLSSSIPEAFSGLSSLVALDLANNQLIGNISAALTDLTRLEYLNLSSNQLSGNLPTTLTNLVNLTTLKLDNNQLTGQLLEDLSQLSLLEEFTVNNNLLIGCFPESYRSFCGLTTDFKENKALAFEGDFNVFCNSDTPCHIRDNETNVEEETYIDFTVEGSDASCYSEKKIAVRVSLGTPRFTVQITQIDGHLKGQFRVSNPKFNIRGVRAGTYDITIIDANKHRKTVQLVISPECQIVGDEVASSRSNTTATTFTLADLEPYDTSVEVFTSYPNPFTQSTTLPFTLSETQNLNISIINATGQQVYQLQQTFDAGDHQVLLDENIFKQSGLYIYHVQYGKELSSGKLIKL